MWYAYEKRWSEDISTSYSHYTQQVTWLASPRFEAQAHICLPVHGVPWWVLLQHYSVVIIFHRRVWYRALFLWYACIPSLGIIVIP